MMLLSILSLMILSQISFASEMKPVTCAPTGIWIKLLINFHRARTNCQSGFGLCFVVTWGVEEPEGFSAKNLCPVKGQLKEQNLFIEVNEADLTTYENGSTLSYLRDKTSISILDPYTLTDATSRALGSNTPITIKPGTYPVSFQNGIYTIVFQL